MTTRTLVSFEGRDFVFVLTGDAPSCPVEERNGRFFIVMGFAGFNTRANNRDGYATQALALATIRKLQTPRL